MKLNIYVLLLIFLVILMYFQPSFLGNLCTNCFGKATLVLLIVFLAIQDISLAILASVVLISSMHLVSREGFKEGAVDIGAAGTGVADIGAADIGAAGAGAADIGAGAAGTGAADIGTAGTGTAGTAGSGAAGSGAAGTAGSGTCNNFPCPVGQTLKANGILCNAGGCNDTTCCEPVDPTNPSPACDSYQDHINNENAHSNSTHSHASQFTNMRSGFRNRKGGKEGFMVSSSELILFEDSKIRGKDSNIYPVSRPSVQNKGLFSGFNLF